MKRLLWVGVGVAVTVVVLRQVGKANERVGAIARAVSPAGLAESVTTLAEAARDLTDQLRSSMAEHEDRLTAALLPSEEEQARARQNRAARNAPALWPDDIDEIDDTL
ncbi:hypothetical protein IM660_09925 [Ruania alkalisoli]|uniref:Uncharacterized protein n=1 Tax=Ruania alkalisoli TaxID=2779775 RepID=A0A7M1SR48_9MICO|nr:hypothetical protein [Ruania alkalisoli]QOR69063.1 hypothetical protein IM660_09925 [Ruania alkalisoli]